jgi:hypothetical protein
VPEYVPGPSSFVPDHDGDGRITEADWHHFNDEVLGGRYFQPWTPHAHPQLGEVLIGGWHTKYWTQNPPAELLEQELVVQVPWILYLAEQLPQVEVARPVVTWLDGDRFRVDVVVSNSGFLPTHLTERGLEGTHAPAGGVIDPVVAPPLVVLDLEGAEVEGGNGRVRIPHLAGSNPFLVAGGGPAHELSFVVRRLRPDATVAVTVESRVGGTARSARAPLAAAAGN